MSFEILSLALSFILGIAAGAGFMHMRRRAEPPPPAAQAIETVPLTAPSSTHESALAQQLAERTRDLDNLRARLASNERIERDLALSNPLTGVANRTLLTERIDHAITRGRRHNARLGLVMLDLEDFDAINERMGRKAGDRLLIDLARRLRDAVRAEDTVSHLSGDRFAIALEGVFEREDLDRAREGVLRVFAEPFTLDDQSLDVRAEVSSALYPLDGEDAESLIRAAEHALSLGRKRRARSPEPPTEQGD